MRLLCFMTAVAVGVAAAFVPSFIPTSSTRTRTAAAVASQHTHGSAASTRRLARREATAAVREGRGGGDTGDGGAETEAVGVIVCDHGSRRENANTMLFEVAERYRSFSGFEIVEVSR